MVQVRQHLGCARQTAWQYLVDAEKRRSWWPELSAECVLGGVARLDNREGLVDVLVDSSVLGFGFEDPDGVESSILVILLTHESGTEIRVTESSYARFGSDGHSEDRTRSEWQLRLAGLNAAVAS